MAEIQDEMQLQQFEDAKGVHERLKVAFGAAKSTFERQNVKIGNRDELENPVDEEHVPRSNEMQAEQIEEIVAACRNSFRRPKVDHRRRDKFQKKRFLQKGQILKKSRIRPVRLR